MTFIADLAWLALVAAGMILFFFGLMKALELFLTKDDNDFI